MEQLGHVYGIDGLTGLNQGIMEPLSCHFTLGGGLCDDLSEGLLDDVPRYFNRSVKLAGSYWSPEGLCEGLYQLSSRWKYVCFMGVVYKVRLGSWFYEFLHSSKKSKKELSLGAGGDTKHRINHGGANGSIHSKIGKLYSVDLLLNLTTPFLPHPFLHIPVVEGALIEVDEVGASLLECVHPQSIVRPRSGYGRGLRWILSPA